MKKTALALITGALIVAGATVLCHRVLRQSNTQVHRINQ